MCALALALPVALAATVVLVLQELLLVLVVLVLLQDELEPISRSSTTRPWAFLSLPGIRVGALALYHNQMCLEHLY